MKLRPLAIGLSLLTAGTVIGVTSQQFAAADISSGDRPVLVPMESCRIADTRPAPNTVGPRTSPLGAADTMTVNAQQPGTDCSGKIPAGATALSLNITAIGATSNSFLTVWASGARPNASSLNPAPDARVVNAVTTQLAVDQTFRIFNNRGSVNVFVDINGYYENHNHDDRYYTEAEVRTLFQSAPIRQTVPYQGTVETGDTTTATMTEMRRLGNFTSTGGVVRIEWHSHFWALGTSSGFCNVGIRVNGTASTDVGAFGLNGTEAIIYGSEANLPVSTLDIFEDLPAGTHELTLYYRSNDANCVENRGSFLRTVHITETLS